jgi:hypothetical protein
MKSLDVLHRVENAPGKRAKLADPVAQDGLSFLIVAGVVVQGIVDLLDRG